MRHSVRLILLGNAVLTLAEFIFSPVAGVFPSYARYLVALLISMPALIAPLWGLAYDEDELQEIAPQAPSAGGVRRPFARVGLGLRVAGLLCIAAVYLAGTISIFFELPIVQATDLRQQMLIHDLIRIKATHVYTDFWSCYRLAFLSDEKLTCVVMNDKMQVDSKGIAGYYSAVTSDPRAAYVFPAGFGQLNTLAKQAALNPGRYRRFAFDGYVIY